MSTYSVDLRERVLAALDRGMPRSEVVSTFQISLSSLKRWHAARRTTGDFAPKPPSGGPTLNIPPAQADELRAQVAACPDATIAEHTEQWNTSHRTALSPSTVGRAIRRLNLTRKKSHS
jgi:transposase